MTEISYAGYRFPPEVIHQSIWLYLRFTISFRDIEDLLAERGIAVSYETVRRWVNHFGPMIAANLRKRRPRPHAVWHLDEVYLKIDGRMVYLWRAVDAEGEVLDVLVQPRRNKHAALKLMRKLLKKYNFIPDRLITDDLQSYGAQRTARRERKMQGFRLGSHIRIVTPSLAPVLPAGQRSLSIPDRQASPIAKRRVIHAPLGHTMLLPGNSIASIAMMFEGHDTSPDDDGRHSA